MVKLARSRTLELIRSYKPVERFVIDMKQEIKSQRSDE
jgi:hypothetical protein